MLKKTIPAFIIYTLIGALILGAIFLSDNYIAQNMDVEEEKEEPVFELKPKEREKVEVEIVVNEKIKTNCENYNGTYVPTQDECEYLSNESCEELGGIYNECASACRNNPESRICTMQCVPVCSL